MAQESTQTLPGINHVPGACTAARDVLARIGDKWTMFVVVLLGGGPRRFNEMKRMIDGISQRMLSLTLKGLERDGLVRRTVTPSIPPRVDYELTALGVSLWTPMGELGRWALENQATIHAARQQFDGDTSGLASPRSYANDRHAA